MDIDLSVCTVDEESIRSIQRHYKALRRSVAYRESLLVIFIESNMGYVWSDRVKGELEDLGISPVMVVSQDSSGNGRPGVITTARSKDAGIMRLREALTDESLVFAKELVSEDPEKAKALLCQQCRDYRIIQRAPDDRDFGKAKATYSGKTAGRKDDVVTGLHQLMERAAEYRNDDRFVAQMSHLGRAA